MKQHITPNNRQRSADSGRRPSQKGRENVEKEKAPEGRVILFNYYRNDHGGDGNYSGKAKPYYPSFGFICFIN